MMREHAARQVEYGTIKVRLIQRSDSAALLESLDTQVTAWMPRQCIEWSSWKAINAAQLRDEIEVRMDLKKADEKGLVRL